MRHGPHFTELRTEIVLTGTLTTAPDIVIDDSKAFFETAETLEPSLVDQEHGFTYQITIADVRHAERNPDGTIEVTYQKPGYDDHVTTTETLPAPFSITTVRT